jgi:hypothetical protein
MFKQFIRQIKLCVLIVGMDVLDVSRLIREKVEMNHCFEGDQDKSFKSCKRQSRASHWEVCIIPIINHGIVWQSNLLMQIALSRPLLDAQQKGNARDGHVIEHL